MALKPPLNSKSLLAIPGGNVQPRLRHCAVKPSRRDFAGDLSSGPAIQAIRVKPFSDQMIGGDFAAEKKLS